MENKRRIPHGVINWNRPIAATVVEVCGSAGHNWFDLPARMELQMENSTWKE